MVFIANFGTFHSSTEVTVFSNCEQVRLTQNGTVIGTQEPDSGYHIPHPPFTFKVGNFSPTRTMLFANPTTQSGLAVPVGELVAEGLIGGKVAATHTLRSPGGPTCIQLRVDTCRMEPVADGSDWVRVYAHVCDPRGETYPYGDEFVHFSVSGEGMLIGDETIAANPVRAEAGIATVLVQMSATPGKVTVRASSPSLKESEISFRSVPANRSFL
jgi:beta-galactosidase